VYAPARHGRYSGPAGSVSASSERARRSWRRSARGRGAGGPWNLQLLTAAEAGRRNRRTIDAAFLVAAAILAAGAAVVASSAPDQDRDVAEALVTVLGWAGPLWRVTFVGAIALAVVIVADVLLRRRWALARDVLVALLAVFAVGSVLSGVVQSDWFAVKASLWSPWGFPELRVACVAAVVTVAGPELVRPVRLLAAWLVALAALGAIVLEAALPSEVLGALALGLGAGALARLAFGTAAAVPPAEQIRAALRSLGVAADDLAASVRQRIGAAAYVGSDAHGPLTARVLGRDAQDTQRLARRWRLLAYRDPPRSAPVGRLEQVEHEALATLMAAQAGVGVPGVVTAALGPEGDALIVTREPDVEPLENAAVGSVDDDLLEEVWAQVARLRVAGISHGRLNLSNVVVVDHAPVLCDFSAATLGAPQSALDIDVAELLVACTVLVGPDRALHAAIDGVGADAVTGAMPYLQRAALTPHIRDLARTHEVALKDLRAAAAQATGIKAPDIVPLRRVRLRDLLVTALVIAAAYGLISQLADIGFGTIAGELSGADVAWVVVALITAQLTFVAQGVSLRGSVLTPLPLLPCVVLQSAIKFINATVPSSAGRIGMSVRFLQQMGAGTGEAVAAGTVNDASETVVQVLVVLATLPLVNGHIDTSQVDLKAPDGRLVAAIVGVLLAVIVVVLAVPSLRAKIVPTVRNAFSSLVTVARTRRKRLELFGGQLAAQVLFALTLGAVCRAYGLDLTLADLLLINAAASAFAGAIPVPGGVGAAEAGLTAGLVAVGVEESTAFAIALTHRLCTYYLPPLWGYVSMRWLRRKAYI
jgi:glycosyltransferase 2 family protein